MILWHVSAMTGLGQIRPWCSIGVDGGLSPDSFRAGQMPPTVKKGQKRRNFDARSTSAFPPKLSVKADTQVR